MSNCIKKSQIPCSCPRTSLLLGYSTLATVSYTAFGFYVSLAGRHFLFRHRLGGFGVGWMGKWETQEQEGKCAHRAVSHSPFISILDLVLNLVLIHSFVDRILILYNKYIFYIEETLTIFLVYFSNKNFHFFFLLNEQTMLEVFKSCPRTSQGGAACQWCVLCQNINEGKSLSIIVVTTVF